MVKNVRMYYVTERIKVRQKCCLTLCFAGANDRTRTGDLRITSALLYQLSHVGLIKLAKYSLNRSIISRNKYEIRWFARKPRCQAIPKRFRY